MFGRVKRYKKKVIIMPHFFERAASRNLFSSVSNAIKIVKKALKHNGIIIPSYRDDCDCICIYKTDLNILVSSPILDRNQLFFAKTVFKSPEFHRKIYNQKKRKFKRRK